MSNTKIDLDELDRVVREMNPGVGPDTTCALIARIRELEAALGETINHAIMATRACRDEGVMEREDANDEMRWIKNQKAILEKGAVLP